MGTDDSLHGIITGNSGASLSQDSQNLLFDFLHGIPPIPGITPPAFTPFDPFATGEYTFALRVYQRPLNSTVVVGEDQIIPIGPTLLGEVAIRVNVVPEPASLAIMGLGMAGLVVLSRRRKRV